MSSGTPSKGEAYENPDLPLTPEGTTYHLNCKSADLADRIILVGDPGRVEVVASFFDKDSIRFRTHHREMYIATGTYKGTPVSVLSTGMGTDNLEIVMNEIHLLKEYDVERGAWRPLVGSCDASSGIPPFDPSSVKLIRVGTCGSPSPSVPVGCLAITRHVIGTDNTCLYYRAEARGDTPDLQEVRRVAREQTGLGAIDIYTTMAHPAITQGLATACEKHNKAATTEEEKQPYVVGTTSTASGFYACQGREVGRFRGRITLPNLVEELSKLKFNLSTGTEVVVNIEMETSGLCCLSRMLGYQAGVVCAVVAKRAGDKAFATPEQSTKALSNGIRFALDTIVSIP
ncbi:putative Phosphorylase superfamily [Trypanosoma vivax]|uniref:Putative nucleoside phosphorylase n=1 Tax=Trypanosoma vivax (strain Y486) TaxID=1055687 RepID=G0U124_TRYVY|nr:putative nucleoside phosphorylase [Trypanosoma vivax]KAH8607808.1 putative Phosphorylase superfamily [Trypanosoma vivax]CCC49779.1 putative nucleoside phosphorylase [Trypanosoma vivax Y486]